MNNTNLSNVSKAVALPVFSGKEKDYSVFWPKFHAYGVLNGSSEELDKGTSQLPLDPKVLDPDDAIKKVQEKALKMNSLTVSSFAMAFTTDLFMELIEQSKTNEYPGGIAYVVVDRLKRKFRPTDRISAVEAEKELMQLKMKDPDEYFDKLATLKNKYKTNSKTFDNDKMIAATIAKAPKKYGSVCTSVIHEKGAGLKLEDIQFFYMISSISL